jgi:NADPH-dependent 2,4-dienoyl-CoA reductase/sulfur reductase-like enzyme/nitrite reductase/ring-hydroxylating ferredoxin subunit
MSGPDLTKGLPLADMPEGELFAAHAFGKPLAVVRRGTTVQVIDALCTHYGAPLVDGLLVGDTLRCPWHHSCFSVTTGEAMHAPALKPLAAWPVEIREGIAFVPKNVEPAEHLRAQPKLSHSRLHTAPSSTARSDTAAVPASVVIVGGGAAGNAAAEMLRRQGYNGAVTMISADDSLPYDRPNLSKDYLAGNAPEDWIPLRSAEFYKDSGIEVMLDFRVRALDPKARQVTLDNGRPIKFDRLLLATGAEPVRLPIPGSDLHHVHYLRTLRDSRRIIAAAKAAHRAVVMGASFIGLEVAASLRTRGLDVHVVAPEAQPLERIMGAELGAFVRTLHEGKGVVFHLGTSATSIDATSVTLKDGTKLAADLVVIGVGVKPSLTLAHDAGLAVDRGVSVSTHLETSVPGIFAAGDIARWPDRHTGSAIRVEHWVVAERQGQTAARNMLGHDVPFDAVPFFWSAHYDTTISYVGHAEQWDQLTVDGDLSRGDATVTMKSAGKTLAVITVGRDRESLRAEAAMERQAV